MEIAGLEVEVVRKPIRNVHLAVYPPAGHVRVAVPEQMSDESLRLLLIDRLGWIRAQQRKFQQQPRETQRAYVNGESHYFLGHRFLLNIVEHPRRRGGVVRNKKYLDLYVRPGATPAQREATLHAWYRRELKALVLPLLEKWQPVIGVEVADWGIKRMRTKWGSCKIEARRIWLNLELAKKPVSCLEYILVHELVHLRERRHGKRFGELMDGYLAGWRGQRQQLGRMPVS